MTDRKPKERIITDKEDEQNIRQVEEANQEASWESAVRAALSGNWYPATQRLLTGREPPPRAREVLENLPQNPSSRPRQSSYAGFRKDFIERNAKYNDRRRAMQVYHRIIDEWKATTGRQRGYKAKAIHLAVEEVRADGGSVTECLLRGDLKNPKRLK